jgi:hypothetical protein
MSRALRAVVIAATMFDPQIFGGGDGHIIHITPVPERLEGVDWQSGRPGCSAPFPPK